MPSPARDTTMKITEAPPAGIDRGARILARSFYRDLRENGYTPNQILALSTELIELITQEMRGAREDDATPKGVA